MGHAMVVRSPGVVFSFDTSLSKEHGHDSEEIVLSPRFLGRIVGSVERRCTFRPRSERGERGVFSGAARRPESRAGTPAATCPLGRARARTARHGAPAELPLLLGKSAEESSA